MSNVKIWISAFRLRTLPLAFSSIITGAAIANADGAFNGVVFGLAITTTLLLQVLSNLANDYGDFVKGTDNAERVGPERAVQSGGITAPQMKKAIILFSGLSLITGVTLIFYALSDNGFLGPLMFILIGLASITAAIKYTAGKGAYGYKGLGDLFVFVFFGLVGVFGTYFLFLKEFELSALLPAMSIGFFSAAVLNLNNMRDLENDGKSGKNTLVVKIGLPKAKKYHITILSIGMLTSIFYVVQNDFKLINLIFILSFIPFLIHLRKVVQIKENKAFDPELKKVALSTFLFSILFWISLIN
jgi:1,4-dihydroxy-2-naphthoate octaprenyltransferase